MNIHRLFASMIIFLLGGCLHKKDETIVITPQEDEMMICLEKETGFMKKRPSESEKVILAMAYASMSCGSSRAEVKKFSLLLFDKYGDLYAK
jgi:hypothetical protein